MERDYPLAGVQEIVNRTLKHINMSNQKKKRISKYDGKRDK
jgi:hypothetical protein